MKIGIVGLGKMGYHIALNLRNHGHSVVAQDQNPAVVETIDQEANITGVKTLAALCEALKGDRRVIWLMIPAGAPVDAVLEQFPGLLNPGDIIIDGGNSNYKDSKRRYELLKSQGISFLDCGTSGGISGALNGACTMIGGDRGDFEYCEPVFKDISVEGGYLYCGAAGSGHFTKMVHNGIEYGMMQSIAEGFEVMEQSGYNFDFEKIASLWDHGSVIRGWLMQLTAQAFSKDPQLSEIRGIMQSSGEGKWTLETALELGVPTPVIALSLLMRQRSLQEDTFSGKVVAALRQEFGGHAVVKQ